MESQQQQNGRTTSPRRVAAASLIGNTLEYYDFFIFGTAAALVFPRLFFPDSDPLVGTLLSFATLGVGFLARPIGGVVFGHFGDRIGRKRMLIISLAVMGAATFLMGMLPTYASIGILAPILLTLLRLLQGFAVGGEWGGAVLMAIEHAPPGKRGFYGSFPTTGAPAGVFLATIAFFLCSQLDDEAFFSWGWRVPFLASAVLVLVGLVLRTKISESPEFQAAQQKNTIEKLPVVTLFKENSKEIVLVAGAYLGHGVFSYICISYMVSYAGNVGIDRSGALLGVILSSLVAIVMYPTFGFLSDKWGRKRTYLFGLSMMLVSVFPAFALVNTGSTLAFTVALVLVFGIAMAPVGAIVSVVFTQVFPARVRYTGASVGFTLSSVAGSAFAPMIAAWLYASTGTSNSIAAYMLVAALISIVCILLLPGKKLDGIDTEQSKVGESPGTGKLSSTQ